MRRLGYLSILVALFAVAATSLLGPASLGTVEGVLVAPSVVGLLRVIAVVAAGVGLYTLLVRFVETNVVDERRQYDLRSVLRLSLGAAVVIGVLGVVTEQWVGLLFSFGIVGFAVTFALQQPFFSLIGWAYILLKRPYQVGDRVEIEESRGDVTEIDFFVTTLWEIDGGLVASNQPSGRVVTLPNSVVLSSHVANFTRDEFPFVWNELTIQVAYETDLPFARETLQTVADDYLGDEMAERIDQYRDQLSETPVDLEVNERPSVNVAQGESWVVLRLRYLVDPRRAQRVRNELYERSLAAFNEHPNRISFPVGRNR